MPPPPVVTKVDLYGSELTIGWINRDNDRAVRRAIVTGVENTDQALQEAINAAITFVEQDNTPDPPTWPHQSVADLPLSRATAKRFGKDKVWVNLEYQRVRVGGGGGLQGFANATWQTAREIVTVWTYGTPSETTGLPPLPTLGGDEIFSEEEAKNRLVKPAGRRFELPVIGITATVILSENPMPQVFDLVGKVNTNGVTFDGLEINAGHLRFDGVGIEKFNPGGGASAEYRTKYHFTASDFLFQIHTLRFVGELELGRWTVDLGSPPASAPFSFPA